MPRIAPFHISGKPFGTKLLTSEQIEEIKEKYPYIVNKDLCEEYNVSKHVIVELAYHYSLKKDNSFRGWKTNDEPVDLVMFDWFYPKTSNPQLQQIFGKSDHFIRKLAKERGITKYEDVLSARHSKTKPRIRYNSSGIHYESDEINLENVLYIVENYPYLTNREIVDKVGCKSGTVVSIAKYYELEKDKETVEQRKRDILTERNKRLGRDVTPELIKQEALKYHSKREFYDRDPSLYSTANRMGIMDDVTKHMVNFSFSIPQIITRQITEYIFKQKCEYNTRRVIAPYELDVYFPDLKIAFEYDGKGWHKDDVVDKRVLCINLDIQLFTISERHRKYEEDIKTQLIENLDKINSWCKTSITKQEILDFNEPIDFPKLFTEEELKILRNNDVTYIRKNHNLLYERYRRYNPDNIDFKKQHKENVEWSESEVLEIIDKYSSVTELLEHSPNVYLTITRRFRHLMPLYNKPNTKKVMCLETGEIFTSISQASRELNIYKESISKVCRGERLKAGGKTFKFI